MLGVPVAAAGQDRGGVPWPWAPSGAPFSPRPPSQKMNMTSAKNASVTSVMTLAA